MLPLLTTIISTSSADVASMLAYAGGIFTDLNQWILVAIGIPVGFYVVRRVIGLVRGMGR
jgi:hypothetical protein